MGQIGIKYNVKQNGDGIKCSGGINGSKYFAKSKKGSNSKKKRTMSGVNINHAGKIKIA